MRFVCLCMCVWGGRGWQGVPREMDFCKCQIVNLVMKKNMILRWIGKTKKKVGEEKFSCFQDCTRKLLSQNTAQE